MGTSEKDRLRAIRKVIWLKADYSLATPEATDLALTVGSDRFQQDPTSAHRAIESATEVLVADAAAVR